MKVDAMEDIRVALQNSGIYEHFEHLDEAEFIQFCWDHMEDRYLELEDMFKDFLEAKGEHSDDWGMSSYQRCSF